MSELARRVARYRVRLGFPCGRSRVVAGAADRRSLAAGAIVAARRRSGCASGRRGTSRRGVRSRHPGRTASRGIRFILVRPSSASGSRSRRRVSPRHAWWSAYLAITLTAAMRSEEAHLTEKFGAAYPAYREGRAPGGQRRFSLARVIANREYRAVAGLGAVLALLWWKVL